MEPQPDNPSLTEIAIFVSVLAVIGRALGVLITRDTLGADYGSALGAVLGVGVSYRRQINNIFHM